jgi:hypothetical protein
MPRRGTARSRRGHWPADFYARGEPRLDFALQPSDGPRSDLDSFREALFGLHLVNHGAAKPRDLADLRQAQNLNGRMHGGRLCVWFIVVTLLLGGSLGIETRAHE